MKPVDAMTEAMKNDVPQICRYTYDHSAIFLTLNRTTMEWEATKVPNDINFSLTIHNDDIHVVFANDQQFGDWTVVVQEDHKQGQVHDVTNYTP